MDSHGEEQCGTGVVIMLVQRAVPHFDCDCRGIHYFNFATADVFAKAHYMHARRVRHSTF